MSRVPAIRFKGFTDPWEQREPEDIFDIVDERGFPGLPVLSATQDQGMISRDDSGRFIGHNKANEAGYKRVKQGDFVVHLRSFQGGFAHSPMEGITSPAYTIFAVQNPEKHYDRFWKHWFMSPRFIDMLTAVTYGIRDGKSINVDEFMKTLIMYFPSAEEQYMIGNTIDNIDHLITLHQRKYDKLCTVKKSMLDKMFPKPGELVPEIRFEGFTDPWEQRKWSDLVEISKEMVDPKTGEFDDLPHIGPGNIRSFSGQLYGNVLAVGQERLISGKFHFYPDDILYGKINPQLGKYLYSQFEGLASADSYVLNAKTGLAQKFLFSLLQTESFFNYSVSVSMRSGMPKINRDELNAYSFLAPSEREQEMIGAFFLQLDHLITLHQRKLELLKNIKKSLLDKMFV